MTTLSTISKLNAILPNYFSCYYEKVNVKFTVHYAKLSQTQINDINNDLTNVTDTFQRSFFHLDRKPFKDQRKTIRIFIFPDRSSYERYGSELDFKTNNDGITYTTISSKLNLSRSLIYVYMKSSVKREVVHALMSNFRRKLPTVLRVGIADFVVSGAKEIPRTRLRDAMLTIGANVDLETILKFESDHLVGPGGRLLVNFFEEKYPKYLDELLTGIAEGSSGSVDVNKYSYEFSEWLKTLSLGVTDSDALEVRPGLLIRNDVYRADLVDANEKVVGHFPVMDYEFSHNRLRMRFHGTDEYVYVNPEYTYLNTLGEHPYFGYLCDEHGNSYAATTEFQLQLSRLFPIPVPATRQVEHFTELVAGASREDSPDLVVLQQSLEKYKRLELEEIKDKLWEEYGEGLLTRSILYGHIDTSKMDSDEIRKAREAGRVLKIAPTSNSIDKMYAAASVFSLGKKIGELHSAGGVFLKAKDGSLSFVYDDTPANVSVKHYRKSYVTRSGDYLYFVTDVSNTSHPKLKLDTRFHIDPGFLYDVSTFDKLQPDIYEPPAITLVDSEYTIERGNLLDSKGTSRLTDDVYEAILKKRDSIVTTLRFVGMRSEEDRLFVEDMVSGKRHQLPSGVKWLKLVEDENERLYLVPWIVTENERWGNEIYVDPMIIHSYEEGYKRGLVDITSFEPGTIFDLKPKHNAVEMYTLAGEYVGRLVFEYQNFKNDVFAALDQKNSLENFLRIWLPEVIHEEEYLRVCKGDPVADKSKHRTVCFRV